MSEIEIKALLREIEQLQVILDNKKKTFRIEQLKLIKKVKK